MISITISSNRHHGLFPSPGRITQAYQLFGERREGIIKVAIKPRCKKNVRSKKTKKRAKRSHRKGQVRPGGFSHVDAV